MPPILPTLFALIVLLLVPGAWTLTEVAFGEQQNKI